MRQYEIDKSCPTFDGFILVTFSFLILMKVCIALSSPFTHLQSDAQNILRLHFDI